MDARLVPATGELLEEILDETYPVWNEGLTRENYARFNVAQRQTAWGATHLQRVALVSSRGRLLSTAKRYDLAARLDGRSVRVLGIGAVFTPVSLRRRGLAGELIEQLLDGARQESFGLALLFSAIGSDYYRRFGFEAVPITQAALEVRVKPGSPAMLVRGGEDRDIPFLADMHQARLATSGWRFALEREPDFIRFGVTRKRLLAGLGPPGLRQVEYYVAEEGNRPAAYAMLLRSNEVRMLAECGDRDASGARVGALLQSLIARAPAAPVPEIRAWLPPGFCPPQVRLLRPERSAVTMMMRPVAGHPAIEPPLSTGDVMYWLGDVV